MQLSVFRAVEDCMLEAVDRHGDHYWNLLQEARDLIGVGYSQKGLNSECATAMPFCDEALRWAYAHLYVTPHAHMVKHALMRFWLYNSALKRWFNRQRGRPLQICCVGGGPGSDLLGFAMFLLKCQPDTHVVRADVLDQWLQWKDTFLALVRRLNLKHILPSDDEAVIYWDFQFHEDWDKNKNHYSTSSVENADVVMMVKFVSAVSLNKEECERKLSVLLHKMKDGAMLFFLDNSGGGNANIVCKAALTAGFNQMAKIEHEELCLPEYEAMYISSSPLRLSKISIQKTWKVSAFLWQKGEVQLKENVGLYPSHITNLFTSPLSNANLNWYNGTRTNQYHSQNDNIQYTCDFTSPYHIFDSPSHKDWTPPPYSPPAAYNYALQPRNYESPDSLGASPYRQQNWNFSPYTTLQTDNCFNAQSGFDNEHNNRKDLMHSRATLRSHPYQRPSTATNQITRLNKVRSCAVWFGAPCK